MKLRNIVLSVAAVAFCSAAFADDGMASSATTGTYVNLGMGFGSIDSLTLLTTATSTDKGGFSGHFGVGYIYSTTGSWSFGPELGYSFYANSTATDGTDNAKMSASGLDMLLNASYALNNRVNLDIKPGVQFSFQKYTVAGTTSLSSTAVRPEINLGVNWKLLQNKPLYLGASYQYVWGNMQNTASTISNSSISDRDMFAVNLQYMFG